MRNIMKKLFVCLFVTLLAFTIVSCKGDDDSYKYPEKTPTITNPDGVFMQYENLKVTNNQAYVKLLNTYGYDEILNWLDENINKDKLPTDNDQAFVDYLNEQKYGTKDLSDLTAEQIAEYDEKWLESMESKGFASEAEWVKYYKVSYIRKANARNTLNADIENFDKLVAALNAIDFDLNVTGDLALKTAVDNLPDSKIEWSSNSKYVVVEDAKATVNRGKYDVEVVLTATATYNDLSTKATYTFNVPAKGSNVDTTSEKATKEVTEYVTKDEYQAYLDTNYKGDVKVALVFFDSYNEAVEALKEAGVTLTNYTTQSWDLNEAQVKDVFVKLHQASTSVNVTFDELAKTYTYKELAELNSTIATNVYKLNGLNELGTVVDEETVVLEDCYTVTPQVYGSKFYLALNVKEEATAELDSVKAEIYETIVDKKVSAKYIAYIQYKNILAGSLAIYDEGLENKFVSQYKTAYTGVSKEAPDYTRTEGVHDSIVLSYEGKELTAQVLYERLLARYGAKLAEGYLDSYFVLKNSTIYNYFTDTIINQDKYDDAKEDTIDKIRGSFENNEYASSGYPAGYGWANYLRDAHGILNEKDLLIDSTGAIYQDAYEVFAGYQGVLGAAEHAAALEIALKSEVEFFNVTAYGISVYIDDNNDGNADDFVPAFIKEEHEEEFLELSHSDFLAKYEAEYADKVDEIVAARNLVDDNAKLTGDFVNLLWDIIRASFNQEYSTRFSKEQKARLAEIITIISANNETTVDRVNALKKVYATSTLKDPIFASAKRAQLQIEIIASTSYTSTSNISDTYKTVLAPVYKDFENYIASQRELGKVNDSEHVIFGNNLDPFYQYNVENNDVTTKYLVDGPFTSETFLNVNRSTKFIVTKAVERTYISREVKDDNGIKVLVYGDITESLSHDNYKKYYLDLDDDSETTSKLSADVKALIKAYLTPAISELQGKAADKLVNAELNALNDVQLDATIKAKVKASLESQIEE